MVREYSTSPTTTVVGVMPVIGSSSAKSASDGIV